MAENKPNPIGGIPDSDVVKESVHRFASDSSLPSQPEPAAHSGPDAEPVQPEASSTSNSESAPKAVTQSAATESTSSDHQGGGGNGGTGGGGQGGGGAGAGGGHDHESFDAPRRGFVVKALAALIGMAVGIVPAVVGLLVAGNPLRKRQGGGGGVPYVDVTTLDALPADDQSRLFKVITDKDDAWTHHRDVPVGAVYLKRSAAKPERLWRSNAVCPHLGCFVNAQTDGTFSCPCHDSEFKTDGTIKPLTKSGKKTVSERGLDTLKARVEGKAVKVQFMNFTSGVKDKKPVR